EPGLRRLCPLRGSAWTAGGALRPGGHRGRGGGGPGPGDAALPAPRRCAAGPGQRGQGMSTALGLALLCLGAPLAAAALAVVIPPLRTRGAPAAGLTVASSVGATLASLPLLRLGPRPGSAVSPTAPCEGV